MSTVLIILLIIVIIAIINCMLNFSHQQKITRNTVLCFTGGLGAGKTYMAVARAIKAYKRTRLKYGISKIFKIKKWNNKPTLMSNIPIKIDKKKYSQVLTKDHLLLKQDIPEGAIVLIDEVGQVASQYDYDNPNVMCNMQELIRFFRHYFGGLLILTDQSSSNIVVPIRRRVNIIYSLNDFHRHWKILPFYKVDVSVLEVTEESIQNVSQIQSQEKHLLTTSKMDKPFFFGFLPYKWQKQKHYDSRCYSVRYNHEEKYVDIELWEQLKTAYVIDISATEAQKKVYKATGVLYEPEEAQKILENFVKNKKNVREQYR